MRSDSTKLAKTECRLREVIRSLVRSRASHEMRLSWRLMFEIEDEAVSTLQHEDGLDMHYLNLMVSPSAQRLLETEKPAPQAEVYPTHTALRMIQEAYRLDH